MASLSARRLHEGLSKARNIGIVYQDVEVDDCKLVVRNLRPDEYEAIIAETKGLTGLEGMNVYQKGHACRAIVEINGIDLRGVKFIEDEEEDPKTGKTKTIKREVHEYLRTEVVDTWTKEPLYVVFRKVLDAVAEAEKKAQSKVQFTTEEETNEEKLRRLVGDLKELQDDIPEPLFDRILEESNLMRRLSKEEGKAIEDRLGKAAEEGRVVTPPAPSTPPPPQETVAADNVQQRLRDRVPLNRQAVVVPDASPPIQERFERVPVQAPPPPIQATPPTASRSAKIAAIEGDLDPSLTSALLEGSSQTRRPAEVAVIGGDRTDRVDPTKLAVDKPPQGGLNPLYRPPPRLT
jgi:hypothetical protein